MSKSDEVEPLEAKSARMPTHGERARTLAASAELATLSTHAMDPAGYPHGSLVLVAVVGPTPVLLLSDLAEHTRNLLADDRCSLMIAEPAGTPEVDAMASQRVTLLGRARRLDDRRGDESMRAREAFVERHSSASRYCDFGDFYFYELEIDAVRYIGGFGRMSWVTGPEWVASEADPIATDAAGIITHMNDDHADNLIDYCRVLGGILDVESARMTAVDRYGFEMMVARAGGESVIRLEFPDAADDVAAVRRALVGMARRSREASS